MPRVAIDSSTTAPAERRRPGGPKIGAGERSTGRARCGATGAATAPGPDAGAQDGRSVAAPDAGRSAPMLIGRPTISESEAALSSRTGITASGAGMTSVDAGRGAAGPRPWPMGPAGPTRTPLEEPV